MTYCETVKVDESLITMAVACILKAARPKKVILFGSAATGLMTRDSDLDLLVIELGTQVLEVPGQALRAQPM